MKLIGDGTFQEKNAKVIVFVNLSLVSFILYDFCYYINRQMEQRLLTGYDKGFELSKVGGTKTGNYRKQSDQVINVLRERRIPGSHPFVACGIGQTMSALLGHIQKKICY